MKLSELDFDVEHRAGKKMGHVDVLSRHVGSVTQVNAQDKEYVLEEQETDPFCTK
jgi:phosphoribosylaminoimidazole carboxylase (NCAIR synthetase)